MGFLEQHLQRCLQGNASGTSTDGYYPEAPLWRGLLAYCHTNGGYVSPLHSLLSAVHIQY